LNAVWVKLFEKLQDDVAIHRDTTIELRMSENCGIQTVADYIVKQTGALSSAIRDFYQLVQSTLAATRRAPICPAAVCGACFIRRLTEAEPQ